MSAEEERKPVGFLLERTTRLVKLQFHKAFKDLGIDMTPEQWVLLDALAQNNNQAQKELGDKSYKNAPTISRILDVLEKKEWVTRKHSQKDRRVIIISLTATGKGIVSKVQDKVDELRMTGWKNLTDKDYHDFTRILNQILQNYLEK